MVGANLMQEGDHVLAINTGYFGDFFGKCLTAYGGNVTHLTASIGSFPTLKELEFLLQDNKASPFQLITITHVDTSTGVLVNVEAYARLIRKYHPEALIIVDSVCALGGEPLYMTEWDVDYVLTGSQKCIGVPAGLSLSVIRPRALKRFQSLHPETLQVARGAYYFDWNNWIPIMKNYEARKPSYFATPSVNHLFALNTALDILLENGGMEQRFKEHAIVANAIQQALGSLGCTLITQAGAHAHTLSCVRYPPGISASDFLSKVRSRGVSLAGGLHHQIKTEYFRIGHMGPSTRRLDHIWKTFEAIETALLACGYILPPGGHKEAILALEAASSKIPLKPGCTFIRAMHACPLPPKCQFYSLAALAAAFTSGFFLARFHSRA